MAASPPRSRTVSAASTEEPRAARDGEAPARLEGGERYLNRELSLLDYNARVLARAEDVSLPLLERVRCLHFFCRAMDDFFQIRVAGLKDQVDAAPTLASIDGRTPGEQLREIRARIDQLVERQTRLWQDDLMGALAGAGIKVVDAAELPRKDIEHLAKYFRSRIFPVLTPLAVDPGHPFPYISHFSLNLAVIVRDPLRRPDDVYPIQGLLALGGVAYSAYLDRPDRKVPTFTPAAPPRLVGVDGEAPDIFEVVQERDVVVPHPYDSYATSVVAFIQQAAADPDVLAIKQTLYRTSGPTSPIAMALARTAETGKQIIALVELKARGDEQANIDWAQRLEQAGVHVVYGLVGLKTHAK